MIDRRTFAVGACAILAAPWTAAAQREGRVRRVGFLVVARNPGVEAAFPAGLADLGYREGRDVTIEWRSAEGRADRLDTLAAELVQSGIDVIVAGGPEARIAAMKATTTIPIVAVGGSDAVAEGWASSLAKPGRNVTGLTATYPELITKKVELLGEVIPRLARIAVIQDPDGIPGPVRAAQRTAFQAAAHSLHVDIGVIEVRRPDDLSTAFRRAVDARRQGVVASETAIVFAYRAAMAELAARSRLPIVGEWRPSAEAGFLITYGADLGALLRRAAGHVDKILRGAKPGALPIERPTKLELVINLKTAKTIGVTIPRPMLLRADHIIE